MADVVITSTTDISDPNLRALADDAANAMILAVHKAVAHHAEPASYALPKDKGALEHAFLAYLRDRPLDAQQRVVEKSMANVRGRKLAGIDKVDFAGAAPLANGMKLQLRGLGAAPLRRTGPIVENGQKGFRRQDAADSVVFHLLGVKCLDETDGILGSEAGSDEITLTGALVDAGGGTFTIPKVDCGEFGGDKAVKNFTPPHKLGSLDLRSGSGWPKTFNLILGLVERDNGNLPELIQKMYDELRKAVGDAVKNYTKSLSKDIGDAIAGAILGALDKVFGVFVDVWEDDVFRAVNLAFTLGSADDRFDGQHSTGPQFMDFSGHGGKYRVWYSVGVELAADAALKNKAVFYEHANFGGRSVALGLGRHDVAALQAVGNDIISSIKVGPGVRVTAYEHAGFTGAARAFTGLTGGVGELNDKISSVVIEPLAVTLFQHASYGGGSQSFGLGRHDLAKLTLGDNQVSSILVPPGFKVTLFEKKGFAGKKKVIQGDTTYVGDDFNDIVSSLIVELA